MKSARKKMMNNFLTGNSYNIILCLGLIESCYWSFWRRVPLVFFLAIMKAEMRPIPRTISKL